MTFLFFCLPGVFWFGVGCGSSDDSSDSGGTRSKCPTTVQGLDGGEGYTCFIESVDAGQGAEWDLIQYTVEGDPIIRRYQLSDSGGVRIITDASRDAFAGDNAGVQVEDCERLSAAEIFPPIGESCQLVSGHGIGSLPLEDVPIPVEPDGGIGDGAGPIFDEGLSLEIGMAVLGRTQAEAESMLSESGVAWRYVAIDDQNLAVTADYSPGRLNLSARNGRIVQVEIEGGQTLN